MQPHRSQRTTHRWIVDGIEEGVARVVEDGARTMHVPCSLLPDGVREGQVLDVVRTDGDSAGTRLEIAIDGAATEAARASAKTNAERTLAASKRRDSGGDVAL